MEKECNKCFIVKDICLFVKKNDKYGNTCKECNNRICRERYKDYGYIKKKEYSDKHKEEIYLNNKLYYSKNKDEIIKNVIIYSLKNKKNLNKKNSERKKYKYNTDNVYKLKENIRNGIRVSILKNKFVSNLDDILGCDFNFFIKHIESNFEDWMNWDNKALYNGEYNYGWDIDHIIPISTAKTIEDAIRLNHYSNLRPLCSKINRVDNKNILLNEKRINVLKSKGLESVFGL